MSLRVLAERCGFSVFAFEFGFGEGFALDPWIQGAGDEADLAQISPAACAGRVDRSAVPEVRRGGEIGWRS